MGTEQEFLKHLFLRNIESAELSAYTDQRVIVKGCGDTPIGEFAYIAISQRLLPIVKTLMYGEPCSTVPVYKKPR
jgi:hypothetical protein